LFYFAFRWFFYIWEKAGINRADEYIFITYYLQNFYTSVYGLSVNSTVMHNGIDAISRDATANVSPSRNKVAIIVGSSLYAKGLDVALDAVKSLYDKGYNIKLRVVGFSDLSEKLRALPYIEYVGRVPAIDMSDEYAKADFLLFPSRNEGFPLVVLEALTSGLPVLVSAQCKFSEIPGSDRLGRVISGFDPVDWANGIEQILSSAEFEKLIKAVKSYDFSNYRWSRIAERFQLILEGK
jgi:glycosyltransferase involved in cell wall biosynthesis